ncbi:uncharacterized protein F5891DRAFT_1170499 [Suillus fuscotomentosus]|uniref:Uncharacterized protein n=1 Tax=Suillus fuscotomentosus TaxID=1912939 RepID=A0AAD4EFV6_9AGAM|nr:uncharacterized protein F5891DRAFT_1170499 [Suillus fuscotomentosus]KAG1905499.1 hypothetical protein F5891DRAFT_1170499 [Suillus fuscotomentosus]
MFQDKTIASSQTTMHSTPQLVSPALARDLQDCRKTYLNILMAFLALQSISGSENLLVATLTLILYTISLHITASVPGVSHVRHFKSFVHAQAPKTTAAWSSNFWKFARNPSGWNSRRNYLRMRYYMKAMIDQLPMTVPEDL